MSTSAGTRGPYAKTRRVRERILSAAEDVFATSGFRATTLKEIALRAGISEGGLAHHFGSRAELLGEILNRRENRAAGQIPDTVGLGRLLAMIEIVAEDSRTPGIVELHSTLSAEASSPEHPAHGHYLERYHGVRDLVSDVFEVLEREGRLDSPLSVDELAAAFVALSDGLQLQWLYHPDEVDAVSVLRAFLHSVVPELRETV